MLEGKVKKAQSVFMSRETCLILANFLRGVVCEK